MINNGIDRIFIAWMLILFGKAARISSRLGSQRMLNRHVTNQKKQVIILAGATSVGKSAVANALCQEVNGEIIIADSVQIYRHLNIGSNKPTAEETARTPHHLVDICDTHDIFNCADFVHHANKVISEIIERGRVPVVVGGSTMWIQWLVHGIPDAPKASLEVADKAKNFLEPFETRLDWEGAFSLVSSYDPTRTAKLAKNDWYRLRRHLEIALSLNEKKEPPNDGATIETTESKTLTGIRNSVLDDYDVRCFFLSEDRESLYRCIDLRCEAMIHAGLFDEVKSLILTNTLTPQTLTSRAIGYRQTIEYLCRDRFAPMDVDAFDTFMRDFTAATRNYARRQLKWYRADKAFLWLQIHRQSLPMVGENDHSPMRPPDTHLDKGEEKGREKEVQGEDEGAREREPYMRVVREVRHWAAVPRRELDALLRDQLLCGAAATHCRDKRVRPPGLDECGPQHHELAAAALARVRAGDSKVSRKSQGGVRGGGRGGAMREGGLRGEVAGARESKAISDGNVALCSKEGEDEGERAGAANVDKVHCMSSLVPEWSAQDVLIRASEGTRPSQNLREYVSRFDLVRKAEAQAREQRLRLLRRERARKRKASALYANMGVDTVGDGESIPTPSHANEARAESESELHVDHQEEIEVEEPSPVFAEYLQMIAAADECARGLHSKRPEVGQAFASLSQAKELND